MRTPVQAKDILQALHFIVIGLYVHVENLHIFDQLCNFDNQALLQVTKGTPGYAPQVLVRKPRSAISHTSAAPAAPATEVQLYYETSEEGKYFCMKCHKPYKSFGTFEEPPANPAWENPRVQVLQV